MRPIKIALKIIVIAALASLVTMLLWNWLIPSIFGGPVINYIQALGLLILSKILLGFGGGPAAFQRSRSHWYWKRFKDKMEQLSPEDREKFKAHFCL